MLYVAFLMPSATSSLSLRFSLLAFTLPLAFFALWSRPPPLPGPRLHGIGRSSASARRPSPTGPSASPSRPSADADPSNKRPNKGGSHSQGRKCAVLGRGDVLHKKGRFGRPDAGPLHETGEVHRPSRATASSPTPSGAQGPPGALESPARHAPPTGAPREAFVARKAAASRLIERAAGREALGARRSPTPGAAACPSLRRGSILQRA